MTRNLALWACSILLVTACSGGDESSSTSSVGEASSTGMASTTAPGDSTDPTTDEPDPEPRADLGVSPPAVCDALCATASVCQGISETDCLLSCTAELQAAQDVGPACGSGQEALASCKSGLSCEELGQHDAGEDSPCRETEQAASVACGSPDGEAPALCTSLCDAASECGLSENAACLAACVDVRTAAAETSAACATAEDERLACVAELNCSDLESWLSQEDTALCPDEVDLHCSGDEE